MNKLNILKAAGALVLLGAAVYLLAGSLRQDKGISERTFFYDLKEKKLFAASREALPPIPGLHTTEESAVRAVVISTNGNPSDKSTRRIAYLEKYAPELKQHLAKVRKGLAEPLSRAARDSYRFVKRLEDAEWHAVSSPEGEKILTEWNVPDANGEYPIVCTP